MKALEERILKDGQVRPGNILKVDNFLNHQIDIQFMNEIGKEFKRAFAEKNVTKIMTIEASGIAIAAITAQYFNVPVVFAKKAQSINLDGSLYTTKVKSYTHQKTYDVILSKKFLSPVDHVLIVDDFLAVHDMTVIQMMAVKSRHSLCGHKQRRKDRFRIRP